jgi:hypothetical protein
MFFSLIILRLVLFLKLVNLDDFGFLLSLIYKFVLIFSFSALFLLNEKNNFLNSFGVSIFKLLKIIIFKIIKFIMILKFDKKILN